MGKGLVFFRNYDRVQQPTFYIDLVDEEDGGVKAEELKDDLVYDFDKQVKESYEVPYNNFASDVLISDNSVCARILAKSDLSLFVIAKLEDRLSFSIVEAYEYGCEFDIETDKEREVRIKKFKKERERILTAINKKHSLRARSGPWTSSNVDDIKVWLDA